MDTNISHLNPVHEIYASVLGNVLILRGNLELRAINVKKGVRLNDTDTADGYYTKHDVHEFVHRDTTMKITNKMHYID